MTDVVIPYQYQGSNQDLKWALSGFRKYLHGVGNIFIIGDDPRVPDVIHVPFKDGPNIQYKDRNIYSKLLHACNDIRVSDTFLFADDDHFLASDYEAEWFPNYARREWVGEGKYYENTVANTLEVCGPQPLYYDLHCPMLYEKEKFIRAFANIDWSRAWGYRIKSVYGNRTAALPTFSPDYKIREYDALPPAGCPWFSTADRAYGPLLTQYMNEHYPERN